MNKHVRSTLDRATGALRGDVPDSETTSESAKRVAKVLGFAVSAEAIACPIHNCADVRGLFGAYRASTLPESKARLVKAHLGDCGACLRHYRQGAGATSVDWSAPRLSPYSRYRIAWSWIFAVTAALLVSAFFLYRAYWAVPAGVRAEVESIDGSAYVVSGSVDRRLEPGAQLREGDQLRIGGNSRAVLRLADGSLLEMNQRSTLKLRARGHSVTVSVSHGAVIVQAAHRTSGHLYVRTPDCRVAVTGTVFSVDAGLKGSRIAVLRGSVQVTHAGIRSVLHAGDQFATSASLAPEPIVQQVAWSPDRQKYIGILAELANVQHQIAQIPFPQPRYSSDLLDRVPADTLLYVSIPNLGDYVAQANGIFQDQLKQSPQLQRWWTRTHAKNPNVLSEAVAKLQDISQYLGREVVIVGCGEGKHSAVAVIADVQRSGLEQELKQQFSQEPHGLVVLDPATLSSASNIDGPGFGGYALVRNREIVFSNTVENLRTINAQLDAGASGFASSDFGERIAAAYNRGAGIILAANLHGMIQDQSAKTTRSVRKQRAFETTGLSSLDYLIAEHREVNGMPENHLNLQFAGQRERMASWLGSPAPIASLDFVSPNASIAIGTLTKDPAAIADDLMQIISQKSGKDVERNQIDSHLQVSIRNDLFANLNGEFLVALDGPVLPTPSWKLIIGVNNPGALQNAFQHMTAAIRSQLRGPGAHPLAIESSTSGGRTFYDIRDGRTGVIAAYYTFADGYMIVGPDKASLMDSMRTHDSGDSLARSAAFRSLLPRDENENYSAIAYQNLSPVLTPLISNFSGETADALRKLAVDSHPTLICAWGEDNRIEAASDSHLFGFDFLSLGELLKRNKTEAPVVTE